MTELEEINFIAVFRLLKKAIEDQLAYYFPWKSLVFHLALDENGTLRNTIIKTFETSSFDIGFPQIGEKMVKILQFLVDTPEKNLKSNLIHQELLQHIKSDNRMAYLALENNLLVFWEICLRLRDNVVQAYDLQEINNQDLYLETKKQYEHMLKEIMSRRCDYVGKLSFKKIQTKVAKHASDLSVQLDENISRELEQTQEVIKKTKVYDIGDLKSEYVRIFSSTLQVVSEGDTDLKANPHFDLFIQPEIEKFEQRVAGHIQTFKKRVIDFFSAVRIDQEQAESDIASMFEDFLTLGDEYGCFPCLRQQRQGLAFLGNKGVRFNLLRLLVVTDPGDLSEIEEADHIV